jgi:hypothetical protein
MVTLSPPIQSRLLTDGWRVSNPGALANILVRFMPHAPKVVLGETGE